MSKPSVFHLVQGGVDNGDMADLIEVASGKIRRVSGWVVPKGAAPGDPVCVHIRGHGLFATGVIDGIPAPRSDWKNRYGAAIKDIRLVEPPISIDAVLKHVPDLGWARYPRSITTATGDTAKNLRRLIDKRRATGLPDLDGRSLEGAGLEELRAVALMKAKRELTARVRVRIERVRAAATRLYALKRAGGECEGCESEAPFMNAKNEPYLEVHHLWRVSDGGPDHPDKVIALCPNCHRRAHHSADFKMFNAMLRRKVKELEADRLTRQR